MVCLASENNTLEQITCANIYKQYQHPCANMTHNRDIKASHLLMKALKYQTTLTQRKLKFAPSLYQY